jgi:Zn-dependent M28 family amino/carboxypeptidase
MEMLTSLRSLAVLAAGALALAGCRDPRGVTPKTAFSGAAAYGLVRTQLDFGARVPGTEAHRRAGDWIVAQMRPLADTVVVQSWSHVTARGDTLALRNVLARFRPESADRVLYLAHWDSRPTSDAAADARRRQLPVPGANDGASGVALLIALGQALRAAPPGVGVDLLFVDGEDYGDFGANQDVLIGSTYFAEHLPSAGYAPLYGVLWDMIGDRDLRIPQELNSVRAAPEVVQRVWGVAESLGYGDVFVPETGQAVTDDHVPLIRKGLRVIDVIDLDYASGAGVSYHHTPDDTLDKVSAESLQVVGDVALQLLLGG